MNNSRADHKHSIYPATLFKKAGSSSQAARADHTHDVYDPWERQILSSLTEDPYIQKQLLQRFSNNEKVKWFLITHPHLTPELFPQLFLEYKELFIKKISFQGFFYQNAETQALLEKALVLL